MIPTSLIVGLYKLGKGAIDAASNAYEEHVEAPARIRRIRSEHEKIAAAAAKFISRVDAIEFSYSPKEVLCMYIYCLFEQQRSFFGGIKDSSEWPRLSSTAVEQKFNEVVFQMERGTIYPMGAELLDRCWEARYRVWNPQAVAELERELQSSNQLTERKKPPADEIVPGACEPVTIILGESIENGRKMFTVSASNSVMVTSMFRREDRDLHGMNAFQDLPAPKRLVLQDNATRQETVLEEEY